MDSTSPSSPPESLTDWPTAQFWADQLGAQVLGDGDRRFVRLNTLEQAGPGELSFLANPKYAAQLSSTRAGGVLVHPDQAHLAPAGATLLLTPQPYLAYAKASQWWADQARHRPSSEPWVHPSAVVHPSAHIAEQVRLGPGVVVGEGARLESGVVVGAHGIIGAGVRIGSESYLHPRVTVADQCEIGQRCILHSGVVIGADGFGFAPSPEGWVKIAQLGRVLVGNDVEMGANTCVDRGALDDTIIEDGVKLDNLVQVGHNVRIGRHSAMAGCVGIAGSARIGQRCTAGGGAIILGHLELVDDVHITAATVVSRSIKQAGQYSGMYPFEDNRAWEKNAATLRHLHALRDKIRQLEKRLSDASP